MANMQTERDLAYRVVLATEKGMSFVSGHETMEAAEISAKGRNERAAKLKIVAVYSAMTKS